MRCGAPLLILLVQALVSSAGTLTGSFDIASNNSSVNLTAVGTLDWVHWGLYAGNSIERKSGMTQQISHYTIVGPSNLFLAAYRATGNPNTCAWNDGYPTTSINKTTSFVWAYGYQVGVGFELTVPADTTAKTLKVFVGAFAARGRFEAGLSDGSAPIYLDTALNNTGDGPSGVYTITFAADSAGQTLTVRWTLLESSDSAANVTLQAAALSTPGASNPPAVNLTSPNDETVYSALSNVALAATASSMGTPVAKVEFFSGATKLGEVTTSPYSFIWSNPPPGFYSLTARAVESGGAVRSSAPAEVFVRGAGGALTGSGAVPSTPVNLTVEGTGDWAHWGLASASSYDHKAGVLPQIRNFTKLGSYPITQYSHNLIVYNWTDGSPTATVPGTDTGLYFTGITNGIQFTAPADTTLRRLRVYVSIYGCQGNFQAYLSDASGPPFIDTSLNNASGDSYSVYTLDYAAASADQTLTVRFRTKALHDLEYGNVTLQAVTLNGPPLLPPMVFSIQNPVRNDSGFSFYFPTESSRNYTVQCSDSLNPTNWQTLTNLTGNGATATVTDTNASVLQRFYRVRTQ